jgi:hypothetical protein
MPGGPQRGHARGLESWSREGALRGSHRERVPGGGTEPTEPYGPLGTRARSARGSALRRSGGDEVHAAPWSGPGIPRRAARLRSCATYARRTAAPSAGISATTATLLHGEFYPSNILVERACEGLRVVPVDWDGRMGTSHSGPRRTHLRQVDHGAAGGLRSRVPPRAAPCRWLVPTALGAPRPPPRRASAPGRAMVGVGARPLARSGRAPHRLAAGGGPFRERPQRVMATRSRSSVPSDRIGRVAGGDVGQPEVSRGSGEQRPGCEAQRPTERELRGWGAQSR